MGRPSIRKRAPQGAHLEALRKAAGFTQAELADVVGTPQPNIALWEFSDKPPRSDVLPALADALGVSVEALLSPGNKSTSHKPKPGPRGRLFKAFEAASALPKKKQALLLQFVETLLSQGNPKRI